MKKIAILSPLLLAFLLLVVSGTTLVKAPVNDPVSHHYSKIHDAVPAWVRSLLWSSVMSIDDFPGSTADERFEKAQAAVLTRGGGVVYFPAGTYIFFKDVLLKSNVIIRGVDPVGVTDARNDKYDLLTKFEFPRYKPSMEGDGTPNQTAFKGILLDEPATAGNCGVVNVDINSGHISMPGGGSDHSAGANRLVFGCIIRNAAGAKKGIPDVSIGQHAWQRFPGNQSAVSVFGSNLLVANNRLPHSGENNFLQKGYVLLDRNKKQFSVEEGVMFDYDNREGLVVNSYALGGGGHNPPDGTPETHPWGFRKGIIIRDNYVFCSGRGAIEFSGDGVICSFNVIRYPPDLLLWTHTGTQISTGSATNGNRAVQMRGWRWTVEGNDYEVYRNRTPEAKVYINDGEGLMHEDHVNSTVKDSKLINNKGNSYISIFACGDIDGLLVKGNNIQPKGPGTDIGISSIFIVADHTSYGKRFPCRNVSVIDNITCGSGIRISGSPASNNIVKGNKNLGKQGRLINNAEAQLDNNENYEVITKDMTQPLKPATRPAGR